jgi:hypothetical protein
LTTNVAISYSWPAGVLFFSIGVAGGGRVGRDGGIVTGVEEGGGVALDILFATAEAGSRYGVR